MEKENELTKNQLRYFSKEEYEAEMEKQREAINTLKQFDDYEMWKGCFYEIEEIPYSKYMEKYNRYLSSQENLKITQ